MKKCSYCFLVILAACGGGGGSPAAVDPPPPAAPAAPNVTGDAGLKQLIFSWAEVSGATHYKLLENPDGSSGFTQVGADISVGNSTVTLPIAVHLHDFQNALYIVEACNATGCNESTEVNAMNGMLAAIGYFRASNTGAGDSSTTVALSADGDTLAGGAMLLPWYSATASAANQTHSETASAADGAVNNQETAQVEAPSADTTLLFSDVSASLHVPGNHRSYGMAWADYDGDGWVDSFMNNHYGAPPFLLHNDGNDFSEVAATANVVEDKDHHSCRWADFDDDGDLDLYCTTGAARGTGSVSASFWRNEGDGTFIDIAESAGLAFAEARGRSVNWIDIDNDDDLDLFFGTVSTDKTQPVSTLFRNDGGVFADVSDQIDSVLSGTVKYSLVFDYQQDNDWDLLVRFSSFLSVSGHTGPCGYCLLMLQNDGTGLFTTILGNDIGLRSTHSGTISIGDFDNDSDIDVFTGRSTASENQYFENLGNGLFQQVSIDSVGLSELGGNNIVHNITWADFDNNGFLDLYIVRQEDDVNPPNELFLNNGDGTFYDASVSANAVGPSIGNGDAATVADFDNDGFLDLLIANGKGGDTPGPYTLLRNDTTENHWLRVIPWSVQGSEKLGVKVYVETSAGQQYREFVDQSGMRGAHELVAHFGLGFTQTVTSVRVDWGHGAVTQIKDVASNQEIIVVDPGPAGSNQAPVVAAGADQQITLPVDTVNLNGTVSDVGLPDGTLTTLWAVDSGPAAVMFGDAVAVDTSATFTLLGDYVLSLTADDGALSTVDTVMVTVLPAPQPPPAPSGGGGCTVGPADGTADPTLPLLMLISLLYLHRRRPGEPHLRQKHAFRVSPVICLLLQDRNYGRIVVGVMSALRPKAAIKQILPKEAANDPKRTFKKRIPQ